MGAPERDDDGQIAHVAGEIDRLVRRLRGLSRLAWLSRRLVVEELLARLEELTARIEGRPVRPIPAIPEHALPDAIAVIGGDAIAALTHPDVGPELTELGALVRNVLTLTRS